MQYKTLNLLSALVLKQWWTKRGLIYTLHYMTAVTITIFCQPLTIHDGCNNNNLFQYVNHSHLSLQRYLSLHILVFIILSFQTKNLIMFMNTWRKPSKCLKEVFIQYQRHPSHFEMLLRVILKNKTNFSGYSEGPQWYTDIYTT